MSRVPPAPARREGRQIVRVTNIEKGLFWMWLFGFLLGVSIQRVANILYDAPTHMIATIADGDEAPRMIVTPDGFPVEYRCPGCRGDRLWDGRTAPTACPTCTSDALYNTSGVLRLSGIAPADLYRMPMLKCPTCGDIYDDPRFIQVCPPCIRKGAK